MGELEAGGYKFAWRKEVLNSAITGYSKMRLKEIKGTGWVNRPESSGETKRRANRLTGKSTWFKEKQFFEDTNEETSNKSKPSGKEKQRNPPAKVEGVMFVPYTHQGKLKKHLQALEDGIMQYSTVGRTKIVERAGTPLSHIICNQTPWTSEGCGRHGCKPCVAKPGSCKLKNLTYEIHCVECKVRGTIAKYHGETHRTFWDRALEHTKALETANHKNALVSHWKEHHEEEIEPPNFTFKAATICKTSLERQIMEALEIEDSNTQIVLNQKGEWGSNLPPTIATVVHGEIVGTTNVGSKFKRGRGRPPEANSVDQNGNSDEDEKDPFFEQFRQRKKRRLLEENDEVEQVGITENPESTKQKQVREDRAFRVDPECSGRGV